MVNEVLQWMVLLVLSVLTLGALRQVALALPAETRAQETSGLRVGAQVPRDALTELARNLPAGRLGELNVAAFVTENCTACQALIARAERFRAELSGTKFVLVAKQPSAEFRRALETVGVSILTDQGALWEAFDVKATPLVITIAEDGRVVSKELTHRVDEVAHKASTTVSSASTPRS